jgi:hypothetical protein
MKEVETTIERIIRITGREPVSCKCAKCKSQCQRTPCLGTPQDIMKLIEAGYKDRLGITAWSVGMLVGALPFPIPMVQAIQTTEGCAFFKDGLCILHEQGLKPTEGKLSHHTITIENFEFSKSLSWNVARTWLEPKNAITIIRIFQMFGIIKGIIIK